MARLLIVSADEEEQTRLLFQLTEAGREIAVVNTGQKALAASRAAPPDALLLDLPLPDMDGLELCRQLQKDESTQSTRIMIFTPETSLKATETALAAGAHQVITKPYKANTLGNRLQRLLSQNEDSATGLHAPDELKAAYERIQEGCRRLGDVAEIVSGLAAREPRKSYAEANRGPTWQPILQERDVHRFAATHSGSYIRFESRHLLHVPPPDLVAAEKVLVRRTAPPLTAAPDDTGFLFDASVYAVVPVEGLLPGYVAGVLNSRLMDFYISRIRPPRQRAGLPPMLRPLDLQEVPIAIVDLASQRAVSVLSDELHEQALIDLPDGAQRGRLTQSLNRGIFELYGMSPEEIARLGELSF